MTFLDNMKYKRDEAHNELNVAIDNKGRDHVLEVIDGNVNLPPYVENFLYNDNIEVDSSFDKYVISKLKQCNIVERSDMVKDGVYTYHDTYHHWLIMSLVIDLLAKDKFNVEPLYSRLGGSYYDIYSIREAVGFIEQCVVEFKTILNNRNDEIIQRLLGYEHKPQLLAKIADRKLTPLLKCEDRAVYDKDAVLMWSDDIISVEITYKSLDELVYQREVINLNSKTTLFDYNDYRDKQVSIQVFTKRKFYRFTVNGIPSIYASSKALFLAYLYRKTRSL